MAHLLTGMSSVPGFAWERGREGGRREVKGGKRDEEGREREKKKREEATG